MGETREVLNRIVSTNDDVAVALGGIHQVCEQLGFSLYDPENARWFAEAIQESAGIAMAKLDGLVTALRAAPMLPDVLDNDDVEYVAGQRALRIVLMEEGRMRGPMPTDRSFAVRMTNEMLRRQEDLKEIWVETFLYGLTRGKPPGGTMRGRYTQH